MCQLKTLNMINDSESMQKQYSKGTISIHGICVLRL